MSNASVAYAASIARNGYIIAELTKIGGVSISRDMIDVTTHQSTGAFEEVLPGILKTGVVPLEGNFYGGDSNGQVGLLADIKAGTKQSFVITLPEVLGQTFTFDGYVTEWAMGDLDVSGVIPFRASIKITGEPTLGITVSAGLTTPFLAFSTGSLIPAASGSVKEYVLDVATGTANFTITPTASAGVITISAIGASQVVSSGQASSAISLGAAGSITTVTISIKETNKAAKEYIIKVARAAA